MPPLALPSFIQLKAEYPDYVSNTSPQVLEKVGGKVKENNFTNTCAVRMSRTLNYNKLKLPSPNQAGGLSVVSGADGNWYAYRVSELHDWLLKILGTPKVDLSKGAGTPFDKSLISEFTGIIEFKIQFSDGATGHLDLWDGQSFTSEQAGVAVNYWSKASRVLLWRTP